MKHEKTAEGNGGIFEENDSLELNRLYSHYSRFDSKIKLSTNPYFILLRAPIIRITEAGRCLATIHIMAGQP